MTKYNVHIEFKSLDFEISANSVEEAEAMAIFHYQTFVEEDIETELVETTEVD